MTENKEETPSEVTEAETVVLSPTEFCSYFLQQLEGGTVIVPVTAKGDTASTVFQFGDRRFKISVAAVKRVRKPKGNGSDLDVACGNGKDETTGGDETA